MLPLPLSPGKILVNGRCGHLKTKNRDDEDDDGDGDDGVLLLFYLTTHWPHGAIAQNVLGVYIIQHDASKCIGGLAWL